MRCQVVWHFLYLLDKPSFSSKFLHLFQPKAENLKKVIIILKPEKNLKISLVYLRRLK